MCLVVCRLEAIHQGQGQGQGRDGRDHPVGRPLGLESAVAIRVSEGLVIFDLSSGCGSPMILVLDNSLASVACPMSSEFSFAAVQPVPERLLPYQMLLQKHGQVMRQLLLLWLCTWVTSRVATWWPCPMTWPFWHAASFRPCRHQPSLGERTASQRARAGTLPHVSSRVWMRNFMLLSQVLGNFNENMLESISGRL